MRAPSSIDECRFFKRETFENGGYVFAWVFKGESTLNAKYKCPKCGYEGTMQKEFKQPMAFKCERCGYEFHITKSIFRWYESEDAKEH